MCAGGGLDALLGEELEGTPAHAAAQDHIGFLFPDKSGDLPGLVSLGKWIGDGLHGGHLPILDIHQDEEGCVPEVLGNRAFESRRCFLR